MNSVRFKKLLQQIAPVAKDAIEDAHISDDVAKSFEYSDIAQPLGSGKNLEALMKAKANTPNFVLGESIPTSPRPDFLPESIHQKRILREELENLPSSTYKELGPRIGSGETPKYSGFDKNQTYNAIPNKAVSKPTDYLPDTLNVDGSPRVTLPSAPESLKGINSTILPKATDKSSKKLMLGIGALSAGGLYTALTSDDPSERKQAMDTLQKKDPQMAIKLFKGEITPQQLKQAINDTNSNKATSSVLAKQQQIKRPESEKITSDEAGTKPAEDKMNFSKLMQLAQASEGDKQFGADLSKAATLIGSSIAGVKPDYTVTDSIGTGNNVADAITTQIKTNKEQQELDLDAQLSDKNSPASKLVTDLYTKAFGKAPPENMTAKQLKAMGLDIDNLNSAILRRQEHASTMAYNKEALAIKKMEKEGLITEKERNDYLKNLQSQTKSRTGPISTAMIKKQQAESINEMFEALPKDKNGNIDFSKAKAANKAELIRGIDLLLTGKSTLGGQRELSEAYRTFGDKIAHLKQIASLDETPTLNQQHIMKEIYGLLQREGHLAKLQAAQNLGVGAKTSFSRVPIEDKYANIQQYTGITPEEQQLINDHMYSPSQILRLKDQNITPEQELLRLSQQGSLPQQNLGKPRYQYSPSRNQTKITYPDGRVEIKDGRLQ